MNLLNSKIGYFFYLILQNRFVQRFISSEDKIKINEVNNKFNNIRADYNFKDYQLGKNWSSFIKGQDYRDWTKYFPVFNRNVRVLEIGPGSGYYSRFICENEKVENYSFCELNINFREYLINNLNKLQHTKKNFNFYAYDKDFLKEKSDYKFDYIFFLSSFHHISNRVDYFKKCFNSLNVGGKIIFIEPTHYFFRIFTICKKFLTTYRKFNREQIIENCSTHAFCTHAEFKYISKNFRNAYEQKYYWIVKSKKIKKILYFVKIKFIKNFIKKFFSAEMVVIILKKNNS
tara:strand:- start:398 stop:1261 length:864 start_codon:yes stop_codon:yes gene_type:complete